MKKNIVSILITLFLLTCVACSNKETTEMQSVATGTPTFTLDGVTYTLPFKYEILEKNGWLIEWDGPISWMKDSADYEEEITYYASLHEENLSGDVQVYAVLVDLDDSDDSNGKRIVCEVGLGSKYDAMNPIPLDLSMSGVTFGSTYEDIKAIYGEADQINDEFATIGRMVYIYETDLGGNIYFYVDKNCGFYFVEIVLPPSGNSNWDEEYKENLQ